MGSCCGKDDDQSRGLPKTENKPRKQTSTPNMKNFKNLKYVENIESVYKFDKLLG